MSVRRCSVLGSVALLLLSLAACAGAPVVPPPDRTPLATSLPAGVLATPAPPATVTPTPTRTPDSPLAAALGPLGLSGLANQFNTPQPLLAPPAASTNTPIPTPALAASPAAGAVRSATVITPAASAPITATPTRPVAPTATTVPVPSPVPPAQPPTAAIAANIRSGPGLDYRIVGSVPAGAPLDVVATNADRTWFRLGDGNWIFAVLVTDPPRALQVINTPTP